MEIDKIFSVSTGNITFKDTQSLDKEKGFTVAKYDEGYFLYTYLEDNYNENYSEAFHSIITMAKALGCRFVCFDEAADTIPGLPVFDW